MLLLDCAEKVYFIFLLLRLWNQVTLNLCHSGLRCFCNMIFSQFFSKMLKFLYYNLVLAQF